MKIRNLVLFGLFTSQISFAGVDSDWGYSDAKAPSNWINLNAKYQACSGLNQSPINISQTTKAQLSPLKFNYATTSKSIVNNGHTVQVDFNEGNVLELDGKKFSLKQFHLHSPSENTILGKSYPLEMHLVHASEQGELAVVAVMFEQGNENNKLSNIWKTLPKTPGTTYFLQQQEAATSFIPEKLDYYRFNGSLTTPPCTEGVRWVVLKDIQQASAQQIKAFTTLLEHPNNRPVQPINARVILE